MAEKVIRKIMAGAFICVLLQGCVSQNSTFWDERGPLPQSIEPEVKGPMDLDELKARKEAAAKTMAFLRSSDEADASIEVKEKKPGFWARFFSRGEEEPREITEPAAVSKTTPLVKKPIPVVEKKPATAAVDLELLDPVESRGFWARLFGRHTEEPAASEPKVSAAAPKTAPAVKPEKASISESVEEMEEEKPGFWARLFRRGTAEEAQAVVPEEPAATKAAAAAASKPVPAVKPADAAAPESIEETEEEKPGFWARLFNRGMTDKEEQVEVPEEPAIVEKQPIPEKKRKPDVQKVVQTTAGQTATVTNEPVLKPGLIVKIVVLASGRKEVEEPSKRVSPSGSLTLPLVGTMQVDGLNIREFAEKLQVLYSKYIREPMVDVDFVLEDQATTVSPWGYVTVLGRVKRPGRVNVPPTSDLTLSMAIQLAGGLDSSAKLTGIKITRDNDGKSEQFSVDLQSVGDKGVTESDVPLMPGDFVYVPERVF